MKLSAKELELARDRIMAELSTYDAAVGEAKWAERKAAALDAKLTATIAPTEANLAAAAEAQAAWQEAGEELETRADHARHLEAALKRVQDEIKQLRSADREERKRLATAAISDRLVADADLMRERLLDAATWLAVGGTAPTEINQLVAVLEKVAGIDLKHIFRESRQRAEKAMNGPQKPAPKVPKQEATP